MQKKYLSKTIPLLADGDFMGIFLDGNFTLIEKLVLEGFEREERVLISPQLISNVSSHLRSRCELIEFTQFVDILSFITNKKPETLSHSSGDRLLIDSNLLSKTASLNEKRKILSQILTILMNGKISVGIVHEDSSTLTVSELSSYPRLLVDEIAISNKFFVLPNRAIETNSETKILFEDFKLKSLEFVPDSQPFPMGVPDMLEAIIESMGVGIVVGDNYGNMVLFNKAAHSIMGLPPSPLPYAERIRRFGNYLPDKKTPYPFEDLPLNRAIRGDNFENELIYIKNKNKTNGIWVQTTGRGVKSTDGKLIGGVIVFRDVTEEHNVQEEKLLLEKKLVQNQKLESLGVLAGGIAHDFNNLLVGVLGNASIILQQGGVSHNLVSKVEQIQQAGIQLSDLTKQLLIYAGLNPTREFEIIDLNFLVSSMAGLVEAAVSKKMQVDLEMLESDLCVRGDKVQIRQVLLNLALNAADAYGNSGGRLIIRTKEAYLDQDRFNQSFYSATDIEDTYVCFEIEDFAGGIEDEYVSKIFDPFFSTKGMGRGLGLSAVLGIVKAHQGVLELHTTKGEGTRFNVWFRKSNVNHKFTELPKHKSNLGEKRVLLIDDEELVLQVADAILSLNGLKTFKAVSGREGLEILKKEKNSLALIILDMNMPDLSGEDVYIELRKILPKIPVVISSGFSKEFCSIERFEDNNCYFLEKPYSVDKLISLVNQVI